MSVTVVNESPEGRSFSFQRRGRKTVRTYTRTFDVFTDSGGTGQIEVALATGIPRMNAYYLTADEYDTGAFVESIQPQQQGENPFHWKVTVNYSSDVEQELTGASQGTSGSGGTSQGGGTIIADPLKRRPVVSFATRVRRGIAESDYSDPVQAYANSAGEKFDPPVERDIYNLLITIQKNTETFDEAVSWQYIDAVNEKAFKIQRPKVKNVLPVCYPYGARSMRIVNWTGTEREENDIVYYENQLEIEVQYPNWDEEILNQGSYSISNDGTHSRLTPVDGLGLPNGRIMLDENGVALPNTVIASAITGAQTAQTVTPKSIINMAVGKKLVIGSSYVLAGVTYTPEEVTITALGATTFDAIITRNHAANARVQGKPTFKTFRPFLVLPFADIPLLNPL